MRPWFFQKQKAKTDNIAPQAWHKFYWWQPPSMFTGYLTYVFYCFLRLRFWKEQHLFQTHNKLPHVACISRHCSGFSLTQLSLNSEKIRRHTCGQESQVCVQGNRADLKYFLLCWPPVPRNLSLNHRSVLPASFAPVYHSWEAGSWVQVSSHSQSAANQTEWHFLEEKKTSAERLRWQRLTRSTASPGQMKSNL